MSPGVTYSVFPSYHSNYTISPRSNRENQGSYGFLVSSDDCTNVISIEAITPERGARKINDTMVMARYTATLMLQRKISTVVANQPDFVLN